MEAKQFIAAVAPIAMELWAEGSPIFPSVRIAQAAHETGWKIHSWNNLVGCKVGSGLQTPYWRGQSVRAGTWEVIDGQRVDTTANWRAYETIEDGFRDQDLLFRIARYSLVRAAKSPEQQAQALQSSGYATDPQYAAKLINIMGQYRLMKYDEEVKRMFEEMQKKLDDLQKQLGRLERKEAPAWFVKEFGSVDLGGIIHDPKLSEEGWRVLAIGLRMIKETKE